MTVIAVGGPVNWLLIAVAAILIGFTINGRRIGFIRTVFTLFSTIIAIMLTVWISPVINKQVQQNEKFMDYTTKKISKMIDFTGAGNKITDEMNFIDKLPVPKIMREALVENNNKEVYKTMAVKNFKEYICESISRMIINSAVFMAVFLVISITLGIICLALDIISKLPVINGLNKTAGLLAGFIQGIVIVWIGFLILTAFAGTKSGQEIFELINGNTFLSILYNNNMLLKFVTNLGQILLA